MGGAEKVLVELCIKSTEYHSNTFHVVSLLDKMDRKHELDHYGIPVLSLDITKNISSLFHGIYKLRKHIIREKPDIIHAHMFHAYLVTVIASYGLSTSIVFTGHSTNIGSKFRELILWGTKWSREYDIVFSKDQKRYYNKNNNKTVVIENGIEIEKFRKSQLGAVKQDKFTFLNVGNLETEKNQIELIHFAKQLRKENRDFQIEIVGEGSKFSLLKSIIQENELEDIIQLLGKRQDVPKLMASAHCYILPSLWEGMPITILEAAITGIPIIATPVGNIPAIINHNRGFVADLSEFPYLMSHVMDQYEDTLIKAKNLYEFVTKNYSIDSTFQKHVHLYNSIWI